MFATIIATNTESEYYLEVAKILRQISYKKGFSLGNKKMPIIPNQISLHGWSIEFLAPIDKKVDFLLAVTAPKTPSISPIPITKTISAPLFSVIIMDSYYGIWQEGHDFKTVKNIEEVKTEFSEFISSIDQQNNC